MTDVYIACASEDLDRVRSIVHGLRGEGWEVVCDPIAAENAGDAIDPRSVSAGAVIVTWTAASRASERVRSEASNALYKNKLIQVRMDEHAPPRPFDQVDSVDLGAWWGWPEDAGWRAVLNAVRLYAGPPGMATDRPQVMRKAARKASGPAYLEPGRAPGPGAYAVAAAAVVAVVGAAAYFMLPAGLLPGGKGSDVAGNSSAKAGKSPKVYATLDVVEAGETGGETATATALSTTEARQAWETVDRKDAASLRSLVTSYPASEQAEQARALLRVLDSQAWVTAVSADTEAAYRSYLASYPAEGVAPGAMAKDARLRLSELGAERSQAITSVQEGLVSAGLYKGAVDGSPNLRTAQAAKTFAQRLRVAAPDLSTAAPRDIRAFSDLIARRGQLAPQIVAASVTVPAAPAAPAPVKAASDDKRRLEQAVQAQAAAALALAEAESRAAQAGGVDTASLSADEAAWQRARGVDNIVAYRTYLASFPSGLHAAEARKAATPAPYSLDALTPEIRAAAAAARMAQTQAQAKASAAREAARKAILVSEAARSGSEGAKVLTAPDGDRIEAEVIGTEVTGHGVRVEADETSRGDVYRGELKSGLGQGLGVYEFAENPNNASAGAVRYEGEHAGDNAAGFGVTVWKNGDRFAGEAQASGVTQGVMTFADGRRYEGQLKDGARHGFGAVWSVSGEVLMAGRWENGQLVQPSTLPPVSASN